MFVANYNSPLRSYSYVNNISSKSLFNPKDEDVLHNGSGDMII